MSNGHVCQLAHKGQLQCAQDRLLEARSHHSITMCAQQNRRAVLQSPNQCFTALDSTDEAGRWIDWRTAGRKKFGIHVKLAGGRRAKR